MLTFVMAAYEQPLMLNKWWETLRTYPEKVSKRIHLVIVDDHGDPPAAIPDDVRERFRSRLFRVLDDIPWNQMGCRNLGVQEAETDWVLMMDPDMVVEPEIAARLLVWVAKLKLGQVVKMLLRYTDGVLDSSSPNCYLIHKEDFNRAGGYDEDYAGHKGWSDVQFMHTLKGLKMRFLKAKDVWVRYYRPRDIADATVNTLNRSVQHNRALHIRKMGIAKRNWKRWVKTKGKNIRFKWSRVL